MSPKLAKKTAKALQTLDAENFLTWFKTLNYLPLVNPQTFQLDMRKRINIALENLEYFDYVIPYNSLDLFLEHSSTDMHIHNVKAPKILFSLASVKNKELVHTFIGKDIALYAHALSLWEEIAANTFKPLVQMQNKRVKPKRTARYDGIVGILNSSSIAGWVMNLDSEENVQIGIYKNGKLLDQVTADGFRPDIQKHKGHPTGLCGFKMVFKGETFQKGDSVEVKTISDNITIALSKNVKTFLLEESNSTTNKIIHGTEHL